MPQALIYTLLALALLLPLAGAFALRFLVGRLSEAQLAGAAALMMALAIGSTLWLARSNADGLRIGDLTLVLPVPVPAAIEVEDLPFELDQSTPTVVRPVLPTLRPTRTATNSATQLPTEALSDTIVITSSAVITVAPTLTLTPTLAPVATATITPTVVVTPTNTPPLPPTDTPAPPPAAEPRSYTVQPGDTLRSIAEQFNVSVADLLRANGLTAEQADTIRPGQVLRIP